MGYVTVTTSRAESLTEALFSLEEPWRSRFLNLVANQATHGLWNGRLPTQEEMVAWLCDRGLYQRVETLLNVWQGTWL